METRILKLLVSSAGGNAGRKAIACKMNIPTAWIRELGVDLEKREMKVSFDGEKIVIEKIN